MGWAWAFGVGVGVGAGVFAVVGSQQCESARAGGQTERPTGDCTSMPITRIRLPNAKKHSHS